MKWTVRIGRLAVECDTIEEVDALVRRYGGPREPHDHARTKAEAARTLGQGGAQAAGGRARAAKLSPERRREIAQLAARERWAAPRSNS